LKRASKVFSKAARTAVFVSLYLSASNEIKVLIFGPLSYELINILRYSTVLMPSIKTSIFGSSRI